MPCRATVAPPSASKKCQSSRLRHFGSSQSTLVARAAFVALFFGLELVGIVWAQRAPDHVLGFQMFNESSRMTIHLFREVAQQGQRVLVPAPGGHWQAPDANGTLHNYAWRDRVRYAPLTYVETSVDAKYGLSAQLLRLQAALDDVVRHIPDDKSTLALVAQIDTVKNGVPGPPLQLRAEKP